MTGKEDHLSAREPSRRPPLVRDDQPFAPRFDSRTGRPLAPSGDDAQGLLLTVPERPIRPFRRSILLRDLLLVALHLTVYVVVIGGILFQLGYIGAGPITIRYGAFDAIFWPGYVWGTLIAAQAGAAVFQRRRWLGAVLGAMASVLLGTWILGQISEYQVTAIVFRSVAVSLAALAIAVSLLRRPPKILSANVGPVRDAAPSVPVLARTRRPGLVSLPNVILGMFALIFVLAAVANGTYQSLEVRGSGVPAAREIAVAPFSRLDVSGVGDVVIRAGAKPALTVSGDDNLLGSIDVAADGDQLSLRFDPGGRGPVRLGVPLTWVVTVPALDGLTLADDVGVSLDPGLSFGSLRVVASGNAHLRTDGLEADAVSVASRDRAVIELAGQADDLMVDAGGQSTVDARDLGTVNATVTGWDDATVRLGEAGTLAYRQSGGATILCDGAPDISAGSEAAVVQCAASRDRQAARAVAN